MIIIAVDYTVLCKNYRNRSKSVTSAAWFPHRQVFSTSCADKKVVSVQMKYKSQQRREREREKEREREREREKYAATKRALRLALFCGVAGFLCEARVA